MPKKRILLMYISEISGHREAASAIEKALKTLSPGTEVLSINAFHYTNPISEKIVNRLYMTVIKKTPAIWDYLYDNQKIAKKLERIKKGIHKFNSVKLKKLFADFAPQIVVCTQAFPCGMVADYKKRYNSDLTLVGVLTDYVPHLYWIYETVDYYIVPSEEVAVSLIKRGVGADKIKQLGIPFDQKFNEHQDVDKIREKLKLKADLTTLLIMGGSHGLGPIKTIIKSLEKIKRPLQEIIVTGSNLKLYRALKKRLKKYKKNILLFGYVHNIHELMSVSDMLITKPGGITISEALAKKLPLLIIRPIPGQEASNTVYLTAKGAAIKIDKLQKINYVVEDLLENPQKIKNLSEAAERIARPQASLNIAKFLLNEA